ncbi:MAG: type II secretion system protein, partial [Verrucomicrobiota bacterium]|nr:type II secretion system protein [Verrucomicrobiota bacterium]
MRARTQVANSPVQSGFMLIEVLIALAIFGLAAVYLVDGAFVASRTIRVMKDTREMEQDLLWVRSQVFQEADYEKMEEGGDIQALSMGEVKWETEIDMTEVLDLYKVR